MRYMMCYIMRYMMRYMMCYIIHYMTCNMRRDMWHYMMQGEPPPVCEPCKSS